MKFHTRVGIFFSLLTSILSFAMPQAQADSNNPYINARLSNLYTLYYSTSTTPHIKAVISREINQLVQFQNSTGTPLQAISPSMVPTADPSFRLREVYSFPNPARQVNPKIHIEVGVADTVDIRIYDLAGQLVNSITLSNTPQIIDDGQGSQYAYEYEWDVSRISSGAYRYVIVAHKGGQTDIITTKKLAVVK